MINSISTSLIVSTYNWPEALNLCLKSIQSQTVLPDEIIIADDGSSDDTKSLINLFKETFTIPIIHVWQPDNGFQLARIRNKAIAAATKNYIIQIDGDLILHKKFVEDHINFAREGSFATGSRVILGEEFSINLLKAKAVKISIFTKGISNISNGFRINFLRNYLATRYRINDMYYMRGCNMAFWRTDLLRVNGYNEEFVGWGREDNDVAVRLINLGISKRVLKFGGIVFHIYHKVAPKANLDRNDQMLIAAIKNKTTYIPKGVNQYL
jgi:glycosyltransferase involved in cell wall biosynthesis